MIDNKYNTKIFRGHTSINDHLFDFLIPRIKGNYLDIGVNVGTLLREVPGGIGVDASLEMIDLCKKDGLIVVHADAQELPFRNKEFDLCILSCILQQIEDWETALKEALRVGRKVIGISPYPEKSQWGIVGTSEWVKSVIDPEYLISHYQAEIEPVDDIHYFFKIDK